MNVNYVPLYSVGKNLGTVKDKIPNLELSGSYEIACWCWSIYIDNVVDRHKSFKDKHKPQIHLHKTYNRYDYTDNVKLIDEDKHTYLLDNFKLTHTLE